MNAGQAVEGDQLLRTVYCQIKHRKISDSCCTPISVSFLAALQYIFSYMSLLKATTEGMANSCIGIKLATFQLLLVVQ